MSNQMTDQQFLEFYDANVDKIYRFVFFRTPGAQEAQDMTSEVFLRTWQYISEGNIVENPRALFYQMARNLLVDYYRNKDKNPISFEEIEQTGAAQPLVVNNDVLDKKIDKQLDLKRIKKALACLKEEYQEVIILRYLNDLTMQEVAEIMEKSYGATRVLATRALNALKKELNKVG